MYHLCFYLLCAGPAVCATYNAPAHGSTGCAETAHDGSCTQSCTYGTTGGNTVRSCSDGSWSGSALTCRGLLIALFCGHIQIYNLCLYLLCTAPAVCASNDAPAHGSTNCAETAHDGSCTQSCTYGNTGGNTVRSCSDGSWSGSALTCRGSLIALFCRHIKMYNLRFYLLCTAPAVCASYNAPAYGSTNCAETAHDGSCTQSCTYGTTVGNTARSCSDGSWSGYILTCRGLLIS